MFTLVEMHRRSHCISRSDVIKRDELAVWAGIYVHTLSQIDAHFCLLSCVFLSKHHAVCLDLF